MKTKEVHFNHTQLQAMVVDANIEVHIIPRGDGKTQGILAYKVANNVITMPRSLGVICQPTYEGMLTKTLPPLIAGLANLGYHKDIHYVIGKAVPESWKKNGLWQDPYQPILSPKYIMHWFNGSAIALVSFNRDNSSNGISCDYIINDEAKFTFGKIKNRFDGELVPAMRGNRQHFEGLSQWQGITFTTDQPGASQAQWLYDYEKEVDLEQIEVIKGIQYEIAVLRGLIDKTESKKKILKYESKLKRQLADLNEMRLGSIFYHEPEPLANLELLGVETYMRQKRVLTDAEFRRSILNERVITTDSPFYPNLIDEIHVVPYQDPLLEQIAFDSNFDSDLLVRNNSMHDSDISPDRPLDIALDWGYRINVLVVGQEWMNAYHVSNAMFLKAPLTVQDLIQAFCDYYKHHRKKYVNLPYDQTAYAGVGFTDATYITESVKVLEKNGWAVNHVNIGASKSHHYRYLLWQAILTERDPRLPKYRWNQHNCTHLITSMHAAPAIQGTNGFKKDKRSEKKNQPQEDATHFSEAMDTLAVYKHGTQISQLAGFEDELMTTTA
jgi:hypothetical protein